MRQNFKIFPTVRHFELTFRAEPLSRALESSLRTELELDTTLVPGSVIDNLDNSSEKGVTAMQQCKRSRHLKRSDFYCVALT